MVESENSTPKKLAPGARVILTLGTSCVVVLVLALLIPPGFGCRFRSQGPLTACRSNLKNLGTAMEMYSTDWGGHYPRNLYLLTPNYLREMPICWEAKRVTYRADFGPHAPGNTEKFADYYIIECTGFNHGESGQPPDYPQHNSIEGLVECFR